MTIPSKCYLCDKPVDLTTGINMIDKNGKVIHGDCAIQALREQIRGNPC